MSYLDQLSCKRKNCAGELMVPIKLIMKGGSVIYVARCPRCHVSYKKILPVSDKQGWLPLVAKSFFQCDSCGTPNEDNYMMVGSNYAAWHSARVKTITTCKNCRKRRAKVVSKVIWNDIIKEIKGPVELPAPEINCPHCGNKMEPGAKACPDCKKDVICSACGAPIASGAMFCSSCGEKVVTYTVPVSEGPTKDNVCPTCQEEYDEGSIFCPVCGQELVCDKCGNVNREGALFCTNCGDAVTKGELSE